jgi:hypothetical protein
MDISISTEPGLCCLLARCARRRERERAWKNALGKEAKGGWDLDNDAAASWLFPLLPCFLRRRFFHERRLCSEGACAYLPMRLFAFGDEERRRERTTRRKRASSDAFVEEVCVPKANFVTFFFVQNSLAASRRNVVFGFFTPGRALLSPFSLAR